jgi:two-component system, chemotaxis family, CheB/CheR fusion protein
MPRSAIKTGTVDLVLPVSGDPGCDHQVRPPEPPITGKRDALTAPDDKSDWLHEIIELLRAKTGHDFRLYKPGTLRRRIERRMAMVPIESGGMDRYLDASAQAILASSSSSPRIY